MARNNFFDNNIENNDDIKCSGKKFRDSEKPSSYVVNLEELSTGVKSDLDMKKVGSDTRSYFEYHEGISPTLGSIKR